MKIDYSMSYVGKLAYAKDGSVGIVIKETIVPLPNNRGGIRCPIWIDWQDNQPVSSYRKERGYNQWEIEKEDEFSLCITGVRW